MTDSPLPSRSKFNRSITSPLTIKELFKSSSSKQKNSSLNVIFSTFTKKDSKPAIDKTQIGNPLHFKHKIHVGYDPHTNEFTGLPAEWKELLTQSNISPEETKANPKGIIDILTFYAEEKNATNRKNNPRSTDSPIRSSNSNQSFDSPVASIHAKHTSQLPQWGRLTANKQPDLEFDSSTDEDSDSAPPEIPDRGDTRSIHTRSIIIDPIQQPTFNKDFKKTVKIKTDGTETDVAVRRQSTKSTKTDQQIFKTLEKICSLGDPELLYLDMKKIGQGASGTVYTGISVTTGKTIALKQMNLKKQPKKELIINEIAVMKEHRHPNIVNFVDCYLKNEDLWVVMEYLSGGPLTDVVTETIMPFLF